MFLSKVSLTPGRSGRLAQLQMQHNGAYSTHQLLWQLFSDDQERTFLFRQEHSPENSLFYVLSENKPAQHPAFSVQSKVLQPKLYEGQSLAFSLRANPTVHFENKRHDVLMHAKRLAKAQGLLADQCWMVMEQAAQNWLSSEARMERWGISLSMLPIVDSYTQHQSRKKSVQHIRYSSVDYQGVLTVVDVERFWRQYCQGFGRAKALGCGLMLIRPA